MKLKYKLNQKRIKCFYSQVSNPLPFTNFNENLKTLSSPLLFTNLSEGLKSLSNPLFFASLNENLKNLSNPLIFASLNENLKTLSNPLLFTNLSEGLKSLSNPLFFARLNENLKNLSNPLIFASLNENLKSLSNPLLFTNLSESLKSLSNTLLFTNFNENLRNFENHIFEQIEKNHKLLYGYYSYKDYFCKKIGIDAEDFEFQFVQALYNRGYYITRIVNVNLEANFNEIKSINELVDQVAKTTRKVFEEIDINCGDQEITKRIESIKQSFESRDYYSATLKIIETNSRMAKIISPKLDAYIKSKNKDIIKKTVDYSIDFSTAIDIVYKSYLIGLKKMLTTKEVHLQVRDTDKEEKIGRHHIAHGHVEKIERYTIDLFTQHFSYFLVLQEVYENSI